jgi:hypothetical protein
MLVNELRQTLLKTSYTLENRSQSAPGGYICLKFGIVQLKVMPPGRTLLAQTDGGEVSKLSQAFP